MMPPVDDADALLLLVTGLVATGAVVAAGALLLLTGGLVAAGAVVAAGADDPANL